MGSSGEGSTWMRLSLVTLQGVGANLTDKEPEQNPHPVLPTYQRHLILTYLCYFDI